MIVSISKISWIVVGALFALWLLLTILTKIIVRVRENRERRRNS